MSSRGRLRCGPLCLYSLVEHQGRQCYLLSPSLSRTGLKDSVRSSDSGIPPEVGLPGTR